MSSNNISTIIPWEVDWDTIYDIDAGGSISTDFAENVLSSHLQIGVKGVPVGGTHTDWLLSIYDRFPKIIKLVVLGWNSIFEPFNTYIDPVTEPVQYALFLVAYEQWLTAAKNTITLWEPGIIASDQEKGCMNYTFMPEQLRDFVDQLLGSQVPIYHYRGRYHYSVDIDITYGSGPCPRLYYIWEDPILSPVDKLREEIADSPTLLDVDGGYPWISPFKNAGNLSLGLVDDINDWIEVCTLLRDTGAKGFSCYPSAWSYDTSLDMYSPLHEQVLEFMRIGAAVWDYPAINPFLYKRISDHIDNILTSDSLIDTELEILDEYIDIMIERNDSEADTIKKASKSLNSLIDSYKDWRTDEFTTKLQNHIYKNFGDVNEYLQEYDIKVGENFAELSDRLGFEIFPENIE